MKYDVNKPVFNLQMRELNARYLALANAARCLFRDTNILTMECYCDEDDEDRTCGVCVLEREANKFKKDERRALKDAAKVSGNDETAHYRGS